ncbi:4-phosphoerythronate dehydrogenase [Alteromonas sp. 1_MG-2023]|uniref:4-phosphoerythronate dehydrogenase n=1 Tax=Alteromonas sp. 1_MG-2023 TaxID=3062669 RepID=UPI0026E38DA4|nr:4-phosphoerythronate dehydrogenase [Alteromonas sp. 1_MG-2023]MDO6568726.1 4-phosphoerythronate dehydrogenase [Alteromonas sp. 1_MG-2023]
MKILFEDTIPLGREYLSGLGDVSSYAWQTLTPEDIKNVDVMAVRSTTKVNQDLLSQASQLKFVTTATSGTNHMDKSWLDSQGISWNSAGGCNAVAVAEYVLSAVLLAERAGKLDTNAITIGIVGAGHVGTALAKRLDALNIHYKLCDPPLRASGDPRAFVDFDEIIGCDVITLHVPFVKSGTHSTGKLINANVLEQLKGNQLLINACRGEVVDEQALLTRLNQANPPTVVLDVFENEPAINLELTKHCWLMTPHIAGHSVEGKVRGTQYVYEQISALLGKPSTKTLDECLPAIEPIKVDLASPSSLGLLKQDLIGLMLQVYNVDIDDNAFRLALRDVLLMQQTESANSEEIAASISHTFATMRKSYRVRRECSAYTLILPRDTSDEIKQQLKGLGFSLQA